MSLSLYFDRTMRATRPRIFRSRRLTESVFANVIVDIQARELKDKLFTYRVPQALTEETFIGAQVLVPFGGKNLVGGFVVSLTDQADETRPLKEIAEVVEPEPFFDKDYVQFLYWIAEYYCSSLSDVISAAVPAVLNPKVKRMVQLNRIAYESRPGGLSSYEQSAQTIIRTLLETKSGAISLVALKQRCKGSKVSASQLYRTMNLLRQEGLIAVIDENSAQQAPRTVTTVISNGHEDSGLTARQKEVIAVLSRNNGQMPQRDLLDEAKTTTATLKKLADLGVLSIVQIESVRDPLSQVQGDPSRTDLALTDAQQAALRVLSAELQRVLWSKSDAKQNAAHTGSSPASGSAPGTARILRAPNPVGAQCQTDGTHVTAGVSRLSANAAVHRTGLQLSAGIEPSAYAPALYTADVPVGMPLSNVDGPGSTENGTGPNPPALCTTDVQEAPDPAGTQTKSAENEPVTPWLLFGVTGSGKTEVYLRLIEQTLAAGKSAMLLVPEISLTPQLARRLKSRFGDNVAIWHSALSPGERYDTWRRLRAGAIKVLLGARSAILANIPDLALIILDEEHDGSYKQAQPNPRYNAKDVALERARRTGALVLFGSATPDVAIYHAALRHGKVLELPERVFKQVMPDVRIIDMRKEFTKGNRSIFSGILYEELSACLERKEQAILLINRRGYASHVFCRACGYVVKCRNCSVPMVFHWRAGTQRNAYSSGFLSCHHCGFRCPAIDRCQSCKGPFIKQYGLGTQRVEEDMHEEFPDAKVVRLDSDVTVRKGAHEEILQKFSRGDANVLIGTQMVAKGLDIANVTLVGVMTADAAFNLPDYRSTERGFQLLTQVAGRAGRGLRPGQVILQTYDCEMPALNFAKNHDYPNFYESEIEARQAFEYPPFSQIVRIVVAGNDPGTVEGTCYQIAEEISQFIESTLPPDSMKVLGPAPCLIERLRGKFRFHLIVKNLCGVDGRLQLTTFLRNRTLPSGLMMAVDVDALDLV